MLILLNYSVSADTAKFVERWTDDLEIAGLSPLYTNTRIFLAAFSLFGIRLCRRRTAIRMNEA